MNRLIKYWVVKTLAPRVLYGYCTVRVDSCVIRSFGSFDFNLDNRKKILSYGSARSSAIAGPRTPPPRPRPSSSSHIHRRPCSPKPSHCVRGCLLGSRQHSATTPCDLSVVLVSCVVFCFVPHRWLPPSVDIAHLLPALVATGVSLLSRSIWIGILQYQLPLLDMPS